MCNNTVIFESFSDTLNISKKINVKTTLFENVSILNIDYTLTQLILKKNWAYTYIMPIKNNKHLLLIGFFDEDTFIENSLFDYEKKIIDEKEILLKLTQNFFKTQIEYHSCKWYNQMFFSILIDEIWNGSVFIMNNHWGKPYLKHENDNEIEHRFKNL